MGNAAIIHPQVILCLPMSGLSRIGVAIDSELLDKFDHLIGSRGHANRSEAFRDLIRDELVTLHVHLDRENWRGSAQTSRCTYQHQGRVEHWHITITVAGKV
jgi:metal-responsive CopG/Arc/MetJ family transcriptional regulator